MMLFEEVITDHVGQFGRYQKFIFLLACFLVIPTSWNNLGIVFLAGVPDHRCAVPVLDNAGLPEVTIRNLIIPRSSSPADGRCHMYDINITSSAVNNTEYLQSITNQNRTEKIIKCKDGWKYSEDIYTNTIVKQWDLVCDKDVLVATSSSIYMAALLSGVFLTGTFSDICGRRLAFIVTLALFTLSNIALTFSPDLVTFTIIRFISGFTSIGVFTTAFVNVMEMVGPAYRVHVGIAIEYPWALGYMSYAVIAYYLRDWYYLQMATSIPTLVLLIIIFFMPESPRWLYSNGKADEAEKIMRKIASCNKRKLPQPLVVKFKSTKRQYPWDILRTPRMRMRSLIICYIWCVNSVVYYGLSLGTSSLGGDDFINFFIAGSVEIPAYILAQISLTYLGRKFPLAGVMGIGGLSLLGTMFVPTDLNTVTVVLAMIGKFSISASFGIIYVFTAELYPTVVRQAGLSTASCCSRVGGVIAPYLGLLAKYGSYIPLLLFGICSISGAMLALTLPETKDTSLPETMEDGENLGRTRTVVVHDDINFSEEEKEKMATDH